MTADQYLLIRPRAGLNDILNQIVRSVAWASTLGRTPIIDARWGNWGDDFGHYFAVKSAESDLVLTLDDALVEGMPVSPAFLENDIRTPYRDKLVRDDTGQMRILERALGVDLSALHVPDIRSSVLVHHPAGGGDSGLDFLRWVRFSSPVKCYLSQFMNKLPNHFNALHVRNTDIKSDMGDAISQILAFDPDVPVFIASDHFATLTYLQTRLPRFSFFEHRKTFGSEGKRIHYDVSITPRLRNLETLLDLMTLARGTNLTSAQTLATSRQKAGRLSGFYRLATQLKSNVDVYHKLLEA